MVGGTTEERMKPSLSSTPRPHFIITEIQIENALCCNYTLEDLAPHSLKETKLARRLSRLPCWARGGREHFFPLVGLCQVQNGLHIFISCNFSHNNNKRHKIEETQIPPPITSSHPKLTRSRCYLQKLLTNQPEFSDCPIFGWRETCWQAE